MPDLHAPNATAATFRYPDTAIADYAHWLVLTRPHQCTLGALVLICKDDATAFSRLTTDAYSELQLVTHDIETGLAGFRPHQKINYLMLMMKDPDVHFHVVPRYEAVQSFTGLTFKDTGWPGMPDLGGGHKLAPPRLAELTEALKAVWPAAAG